MVAWNNRKGPYSTGYAFYHDTARVDDCDYYMPDDRCALSLDKCSDNPMCFHKTNCTNHGSGIKYDDGKPRIGEMIEDFGPELLEVCKAWEFGAKKHGKSNWKELDNGLERYTNAMQRHFLKEKDQVVDDETGILHASHLAWNALARLHFVLEKEKANGRK